MINSLLQDIKKNNHHQIVSLTGKQNLSIPEIVRVAKHGVKINFLLSSKQKRQIQTVHQQMVSQVEAGIPIYGTTSAYGGQAAKVLVKGGKNHYFQKAVKLSKTIIHVDVSTGPPIPKEITRAAMLLRINMLLPGFSAVRLSTLDTLRLMINADITPIVGQYGSVGASGDLAQNGRVLSTLMQLKTAQVWDGKGNVKPARLALKKAGLQPLLLDPKEGLGMVNGDNFSTASATIIAYELAQLMLLNLGVAALNIQALKGSDRNFHTLLSRVRPHPGQKFTSEMLRGLLKDSKLAHQELLTGHQLRPKGEIIQDPYSIRCLPQFYGPDWETMAQVWKTIKINANSVSDNPLWTIPGYTNKGEEPYQWVSGGNFLAMHMSDAMDKMRKIAVHVVKQNDRHLARMINPQSNNGLPANLSDKSDISQCTFKGLQTQMGMYEVYATIMAAPVSTAFGIHEENNQDLTSHGMTSAKMTFEVLKLTKYALATNLIAAAQAIDLRGGAHLLSPATLPLYNWVRSRVSYIKGSQPLGHYVETIAKELNKDEELMNFILQIGK
jgi:phenylalanine ammonia-lyase